MPAAIASTERSSRTRSLRDVGPSEHQRKRVGRVREAADLDQASDHGSRRGVPERATRPARVPLVDDDRAAEAQRRRQGRLGGGTGGKTQERSEGDLT